MQSVDMWSLGLIFFILLGGYHPFYHKNTTKMFIRVAAGDWEFTHAVWDNISEEAKVLYTRSDTVVDFTSTW